MKRRHLKMLGYSLFSIPYYEWNALKSEDARIDYLRSRIAGMRKE